MTLEECQKRVEEIRGMAHDDEAAHDEEDRLHRDVLAYLAEVGPAELGELARIALSTSEIDFARWCA